MRLHVMRRWGVFIALVSAPAVYAGGVDLQALLRKAANPPVAYTCKIVVTTWHSHKSDAAMLREWRLPDERYRIEYLAPRPLQGVVLLSDGKQRWRLINDRPVWHLPVDDTPSLQVHLLSRNYRLSAPVAVTLLGRKAWRVEVVPKSKGKPYHRFWLDAQHGILLRTETYRADGTPWAFMTVTELRFLTPREVPSRLFAPPAKRPPRITRTLTPAQAQRQWSTPLPARLPAGFVCERVEEVRLPKTAPFLHARYTDGLILVSLFVVASDEDDEDEPPIVLPTERARLPVIRWRANGHTCYLVGSVSRPLLHRIARVWTRRP